MKTPSSSKVTAQEEETKTERSGYWQPACTWTGRVITGGQLGAQGTTGRARSEKHDQGRVLRRANDQVIERAVAAETETVFKGM